MVVNHLVMAVLAVVVQAGLEQLLDFLLPQEQLIPSPLVRVVRPVLQTQEVAEQAEEIQYSARLLLLGAGAEPIGIWMEKMAALEAEAVSADRAVQVIPQSLLHLKVTMVVVA